MRDFDTTPEPSGRRGEPKPSENLSGLPFVVQKHAARRLHYDFRLAWNGVLKSWAVTKGPSYYPGDKRLAVQTEDHPMDYGRFEGTIPQGQYGGGAVMVWDLGRWTPHGDVDRGLDEGLLKFDLHGKKLRGAWALVRMHGDVAGKGNAGWLLIKEKDKYAQEKAGPAITDRAPNSILTKRTLGQIANGRKQWVDARRNGHKSSRKNQAAAKKTATFANVTRKQPAKLSTGLASLPQEEFPSFISPQLAHTATVAPSGIQWIHEIKLDGYRIQIHVQSAARKGNISHKVKLLTRKGLNWSSRMPSIAGAAAGLDVDDAVLDGEVVVLDERGASSFAELQAAFQEGRQRNIAYVAFDLLHINGRNVRNLPLVERKRMLFDLLGQPSIQSPIQVSEHFQADGKVVFAKACALGAEGIISKIASSKYVSGRESSWLKVKCSLEQEFVIGGFTPPSKGGRGIGAILLGYYEAGKLRYAGRSGTGFTGPIQRMLRDRLNALIQKNSPFADVPGDARRKALWVKPQIVAQIKFATWTRDKLVRQAAFKGLREDKPANEVVREVAATPNLSAFENAAKDRSVTAPRRPARERRQEPRNRPRKGRQEVSDPPITHPGKILDEDSGMTKQMLAEYYRAVAERMLPHVANRPLSVVRCPEGSGKPCFFQKHAGRGLPGSVGSVVIPSQKTGKKEDYLTIDSAEGLIGLAQLGVLEIHPWGSQNDSLEEPDRIVFDLDPDTAIEWKTLAASAKDLQKRLKQSHLKSFLKGTGGKGLHVVVPIEPITEWPRVKEFAHRLVLEMEMSKPELYVTKMTRAARKGRIYLDYLRNDRGATSIAPYSPRARRGVPVAMPLRWGELASASAPAFHVSDLADWRTRLGSDPWKAIGTLKQRLPL